MPSPTTSGRSSWDPEVQPRSGPGGNSPTVQGILEAVFVSFSVLTQVVVMSSVLKAKRCKPCEGGIPPMSLEEARALLQEIPHWEIVDDGQAIRRIFTFSDHYEVMAFVNAIAWISHRENHHPVLTVGYSRCEVVYTTHAVEGLTENDFICAAKVDALLE